MWQPSPERVAATNMARFMEDVRRQHGVEIDDYADLYAWSIREPEAFWRAVWSFCDVVGDAGRARRGRQRTHARRPLVP